MRRRFLAALLFCWAAACSSDRPPLVAADVRVPPPISGVSTGAAYLGLENTGDTAIRITEVRSAQLESVSMHETLLEDGVSRMHKLGEVVIPPGEKSLFEPGGKHLMLRYGEAIPDRITLRFYGDETLLLSVDVTPGDPG